MGLGEVLGLGVPAAVMHSLASRPTLFGPSSKVDVLLTGFIHFFVFFHHLISASDDVRSNLIT